ncbi:CinA family protein [Agromyces allii]|uniref:CinA family protein n=1 Tax=Agromyces allii TaxID=393607 RepID=A0ABP5BKZ6_9MICO|nr:nicotinamide-nucleotide amidohydrolase family protein [Agromyces allii]
MGERMPRAGVDAAAELIALLAARGLGVAAAESLTGGLVVAELVRVPGASAVVHGGVVAYATPVKHSVLGVPADLLAREGAVHPDVAAAMAEGVRGVLAVDGAPASVGIATTGVAGPDPQDGHPPGVVFVAVSVGERTEVRELALSGGRDEIRRATVDAAIAMALEAVLTADEARDPSS